jgi:integral membrane sensor domain MASE1
MKIFIATIYSLAIIGLGLISWFVILEAIVITKRDHWTATDLVGALWVLPFLLAGMMMCVFYIGKYLRE